MKKIISLFLVCLTVLSLSSCQSNSNYNIIGAEKLPDTVASTITIKEIFRDIRKIDLYRKMDTTGLKAERTENKDSSTVDIYYKDEKGNVVYETGEGYGEEFFICYEKSTSGRDLKCQYWNEGDKYLSLRVSCDDYSVLFDGFDKELPFGAEVVSVTINQNNQGIMPTYVNYNYSTVNDKSDWVPEYAMYEDGKGIHRFYGWKNNEGVFECDDCILYEKLTSEPENSSKLLCDEALTVMPEFIFGSHKFSYLNSTDGQWYVTADFIMTFETEEARKSFAEKYGIKKSEPRGNEDEYITLRTGKITVPIATDCKNFKDYLSNIEVDDPYYVCVSLNEKGEISEIDRGGMYSLY